MLKSLSQEAQSLSLWRKRLCWWLSFTAVFEGVDGTHGVARRQAKMIMTQAFRRLHGIPWKWSKHTSFTLTVHTVHTYYCKTVNYQKSSDITKWKNEEMNVKAERKHQSFIAELFSSDTRFLTIMYFHVSFSSLILFVWAYPSILSLYMKTWVQFFPSKRSTPVIWQLSFQRHIRDRTRLSGGREG